MPVVAELTVPGHGPPMVIGGRGGAHAVSATGATTATSTGRLHGTRNSSANFTAEIHTPGAVAQALHAVRSSAMKYESLGGCR